MTLQIAGRQIGPGHPCFIIAEAGVNHDGDITEAVRLIDAAVQAGADAVKFQTFVAERLVTVDAPSAPYQRTAPGSPQKQFEMLKPLELSPADHRQLQARCLERGIIFLSTPFDEGSADMLDELSLPAFKISSGDLTNLPLLAHIARKGKPVILSTGMSTLPEIEVAVRTIRDNGDPPMALLHCVSRYPAQPAEVNLRGLQTMAVHFGVPVGYSDHTFGSSVPIAAVALGACILEKHLTTDRRRKGPDHSASMEPDELTELVAGVRTVEAALGDGQKRPVPSEREIAAVARKSIVAAADIPRGVRLTADLLTCKRPGTGLPPAMLAELLGRTTRHAIPAGNLLTLEALE